MRKITKTNKLSLAVSDYHKTYTTDIRTFWDLSNFNICSVFKPQGSIKIWRSMLLPMFTAYILHMSNKCDQIKYER